MKLTPLHPPGRANRKARGYTSEIKRLHAKGYSLDAIRVALAQAGLTVSRSTVLRELAKEEPPHMEPDPPPQSLTRDRLVTATQQPPTAEDRLPAKPLVIDGLRSGKDIAEAFVRVRINNPLLRKQEP